MILHVRKTFCLNSAPALNLLTKLWCKIYKKFKVQIEHSESSGRIVVGQPLAIFQDLLVLDECRRSYYTAFAYKQASLNKLPRCLIPIIFMVIRFKGNTNIGQVQTVVYLATRSESNKTGPGWYGSIQLATLWSVSDNWKLYFCSIHDVSADTSVWLNCCVP